MKDSSRGQKLAAGIWLTLIVAAAVYGVISIARGQALESNILALLPNSLSTTTHESSLERRFVVLVGADHSARAAAESLQEQLRSQPQLIVSSDQLPEAVLSFFRPYLHQLLSPSQRTHLQQHSAEQLAQQALNALLNPVDGLRPYALQEDPFNLGGEWLSYGLASSVEPGAIPSLRDGDQRWFIISGEVTGSAFDPAMQQIVENALEHIAKDYPAVTLLRSGVVFHAAEAARLAKAEISTVGVGSLLAILIIVIGLFRRLQDLLIIALTLASSTAIALAVCLLVFEQVHLITLAFGATLLGLAVDYCFHLLIKTREVGSANSAYLQLRRSLWLGAASSIAAYAFQLLSPMTGLHQFAVFMAAGLAAAVTTLATTHPFLSPQSRGLTQAWDHKFRRYVLPSYQALTSHPKVLSAVFAALLAALGYAATSLQSDDNLRSLNTSSDTLLASESRVRDLLQLPDNSRYFSLSRNSSDALLTDSVELANNIDALSPDAPLPAKLVVGRIIPPIHQQRSDAALVQQKLYGPKGALNELCALLASSCEWRQSLPTDFVPGLTLARDNAGITELLPALLFSRSADTRLMLPANAALSSDQLHQLAQQSNAQFHDTPQELSNALAEFRQDAGRSLGLFLILFALIMAFVYRRRSVIPLGTLSLVLLISLVLGTGGHVSLFHVLALLLVIGLAVDTVIFYLEIGFNSSSWLAATMASLTSILAFGLLAVSDVPVLNHFGHVVFCGLLASWLLTPLMILLFESMSRRFKEGINEGTL